MDIPEGLTEIRLSFLLAKGNRAEVKFCQPEDTCDVFHAGNNAPLNLTFEIPDTYSVRICQASACPTPWQVLLLQPIDSYSNPKNQRASTILFSNENVTVGFAISALGDKQFATWTYTKVKAQALEQIKPKQASLGLSEPRSGLTNMGNTCFFNAAMQLIKSTPELERLVRQKAIKERDTSLDIFFDELDLLLSKMNKSGYLGRDDIMPTFEAYQKKFGNVGHEGIQIGRQFDSSEFLAPILDELREAHVQIYRKNIKKGPDIVQIPTGPTVNQPEFEITPMPTLEVPDDTPQSFQAMLEKAFHNSEAPPENWIPDIKTENRDSYERVSRLIAPSPQGFDSLTVIIKRLHYDRTSHQKIKTNTPVVGLGGDLTIPFMTKGATETLAQNMRVRSFVVHYGEATGGHYFSYFRDQSGKWFEANDSRVSEVTDFDRFTTDLLQNSTVISLEKTSEVKQWPGPTAVAIPKLEVELPETKPGDPPPTEDQKAAAKKTAEETQLQKIREQEKARVEAPMSFLEKPQLEPIDRNIPRKVPPREPRASRTPNPYDSHHPEITAGLLVIGVGALSYGIVKYLSEENTSD